MANNDLGSQLSQLTEMKNLISELPTLFEKLGTSIGNQSDPLRQLAGSMEEATNTEGLKDMDAALKELSSGLDGAGGDFAKFGKKAGAAMAIVGGAKAGFNAFTQTLSGTFSMISSLTTSVFNLGSAIVGGLMGTWKSLIGIAFSLQGAGDSLAKQFEKLKNDFGSLANNEGKAVVNAFKEIRKAGGFAAQTGIGLRFAFGGGLAAGLDQIAEVARDMGNSFGQLKDQFVQNAVAAVVMNKGLGVTGKAMASLALTARAAGETMTEALTETMQQIIYLEKQFGIDGKLIGKNFDAMAQDVIKFGHMTREELTATAAYATKLGLSIESLGGVFDKFENFENAATGAAKMAEAFGMNVDAMAMMNAESPAEQIDMMRQAFLETGKSLDDLSRSEKAYLQELTGLKGDELYKAFDPSNADVSFDDMLEAAEDAADKMTPEEAMLAAADKIEKAMERAQKSFTGFFDAFSKGLKDGLAIAMMHNKTLKKLRASLYDVYYLGRGTIDRIFGKDGVFSKQSSKLMESFEKVLDRIVQFFKKLSDELVKLAETGNFGDFITNMKTEIENFLNSPELQNLGGNLLEKINQAVSYVLKELPNVFTAITDILFPPEGQETEINILPEGKLKEEWKKFVQTIEDSWPDIEESLIGENGLFTKIGKALTNWAKGPGKPIIVGAMGILFGPAVLKGVIFGAGSALSSVLVTAMFNPAFYKAVGEGTTKAFKGIKTAFSSIGTTLKGLGKPLKSFGSLLKNIGSKILPKLSSGSKLLGKAFVWIQPVISGVKTISRLFTDLSEIITGPGDAMDKIGLAVEAVFGRIAFFTMDFAASFTDLFDLIVGGILGLFGIEIPSLTEFIFGEGGPEEIYNQFIEIDWAYIPTMIKDSMITPAWDFLKGLGDDISKLAEDIYGYFTNIDFAGIVDNVVASFKDLPGKIGDAFSSAADTALSAVTTVFRIESPSKAFADIANNIVEGMDGSLDFSSTFSNAASAAMSAAQVLLDPIALVDTVGEMIPGVSSVIENAKGMVESGVSSVAEGISSVTGKLAELAPIAADAMVTKVANGLAADGSVAVQHEGLNIQVNFKVNIDSKDLAAALGDDAEGGPFFVINTDRGGGGTEAAESAGE